MVQILYILIDQRSKRLFFLSTKKKKKKKPHFRLLGALDFFLVFKARQYFFVWSKEYVTIKANLLIKNKKKKRRGKCKNDGKKTDFFFANGLTDFFSVVFFFFFEWIFFIISSDCVFSTPSASSSVSFPFFFLLCSKCDVDIFFSAFNSLHFFFFYASVLYVSRSLYLCWFPTLF